MAKRGQTRKRGGGVWVVGGWGGKKSKKIVGGEAKKTEGGDRFLVEFSRGNGKENTKGGKKPHGGETTKEKNI